ncbi:TetR/AcrR family transcriptional regulator [Streptomyces sp.]|uniref:TetR/AcrR family transcriptional regulator n=1 Tax=Streptomyces sp. TaxID=1931 RepID=UPI002D2FD8E2|nr:TetR/AcrR family transcriptional regulator [Streptomyces sp.]HZF89925.1 TetR/AcrR family transcriptional regulator [Streptomyces sp.]
MSRTNAPHGRVGRPPVTSRTQILNAARRLIDRDGWEKLTIRRLAAEIGIGATTLYHHVQDKEDLLFLLIQEYADQIPHPALPSEPRDRIIVAITAVHDALAAWPWAAEVLTADGFLVRLGDSALRLVETIVSGAIDHGCTPEQAVYVVRSLWYYTVGEILVRAHSAHRADDEQFDGQALGSILDASLVPRLASLSGQWSTLSSRDDYPRALPAFVDGLLAQATAGTPQRQDG